MKLIILIADHGKFEYPISERMFARHGQRLIAALVKAFAAHSPHYPCPMPYTLKIR